MANQLEGSRPPTFHPPTVWGSSFASFSSLDSELDWYNKEVEAFKEKVKDLLRQSSNQSPENIDLINSLCRLGISYHFENEIQQQLDKIFGSIQHIIHDNEYDLYTLGLLFRLLRQHGHNMSCAVFDKFKGSNGGFKESTTNDVKGLLSLYEATFLRVHGEGILEEALAFTRQRLEILAEKSSSHLSQHIRNALLQPFHHSVKRIDTRQYIAFYEAEESRNQTLLAFAKLDFNRLQLLHRNELALLSRWWEESKLGEKLPYARDRIPEGYLWAVELSPEPEFSCCRSLITKHLILSATIDDTYDEYGTFDELQLFTTALQRLQVGRFSSDVADELPEYMKFLYKFLINYWGEPEKDDSAGCPYKASFSRQMFTELAICYMTQTQWLKDGYTPTLDEYMLYGSVMSGHNFLISALFLGMKSMGLKEILWVRHNPNIVKTIQIIARLWNDLIIREGDDKPSSLLCYMKEHGVSRSKAMEELHKMIENGWKDINEEWMKKPTNTTPKSLVKYGINLVRLYNFFYRGGIDSYTHAEHMKDYITALFVDPLPMQ